MMWLLLALILNKRLLGTHWKSLLGFRWNSLLKPSCLLRIPHTPSPPSDLPYGGLRGRKVALRQGQC